jgi:AAA ATPase domain/Bacterial transcriptional activator domain
MVGDGRAAATFSRMLPYGGTPIRDTLKREGRLRGDLTHPDYDFLDLRLNEYHRLLVPTVRPWIYKQGLSCELNYAWDELETVSRLAWGLEGVEEYRAALRSLTAESNQSLHESEANQEPYAERLVALDSLCESHHQLLIRLHAANHDRSSALRAYHQCMRVLRREMGVEPDPATLELFERILKSEPGASRELSSGSPVSPAAKPVSQLQKVRALIGRTMEWHRLASAWQSAVEDGPRVAVISGEPGIGKTRLADELYQSCVRQGHAAASSRCYTGQGQVAYAPVAEWLRSDAVRASWTRLRLHWNLTHFLECNYSGTVGLLNCWSSAQDCRIILARSLSAVSETLRRHNCYGDGGMPVAGVFLIQH